MALILGTVATYSSLAQPLPQDSPMRMAGMAAGFAIAGLSSLAPVLGFLRIGVIGRGGSGCLHLVIALLWLPIALVAAFFIVVGSSGAFYQ